MLALYYPSPPDCKTALLSEYLRQRHPPVNSFTHSKLGLPFGCLFLVLHLNIEVLHFGLLIRVLIQAVLDAIVASVTIAIPALRVFRVLHPNIAVLIFVYKIGGGVKL